MGLLPIKLHVVILVKDDPKLFRVMSFLLPLSEEIGFDILLVDDLSSLQFRESINSLMASYPQVRLVSRPLNRDFSAQRNFAMAQFPKGDWVFYLDSDEMVPKNFFKKLFELCDWRSPFLYSFPRLNTYWAEENQLWWGLSKRDFDRSYQRSIPKVDLPFLLTHPWYSEYVGAEGWPDYQKRLMKITLEISFQRKVHEIVAIHGQESEGIKLWDPDLVILHHKNIRTKSGSYKSWL